MKYRLNKYGEQLSELGFGCMRFARKNGKIDMEAAERQIMLAYESGVNYYDTAYIYPGSEAAVGEIFEKNGIREKINIATKLPQYLVANGSALDRYFNEQCARLRTDYVDYYLMHLLTSFEMWEKLKNIGVIGWIEDKKKSGAIRNVGFSYHGSTGDFLRILNDYDWDMCQIQYNYFDEVSQAGVQGLKAAAAKGIPVVIMEPLRGGKLVNMLPESAKDAMKRSGRGWSPAEWGFRWLFNQPEVTVVLSGMNSEDMVRENCRIAFEADVGNFTEEDFGTIANVVSEIKEREKVGCTGCRYCMPCPKGVDIPGYFSCYNAMSIESKSEGRTQFFRAVALSGKPAFASQCVGCGKCESHCPQSLPIREKLKEADKALRPLPYKIFYAAARKFMLRKSSDDLKKGNKTDGSN
ncbi:MAG: aldo/keto reductase [Clostridia bacterium]|nr:aldo/keto reductase [Clostridia bacterium]